MNIISTLQWFVLSKVQSYPTKILFLSILISLREKLNKIKMFSLGEVIIKVIQLLSSTKYRLCQFNSMEA